MNEFERRVLANARKCGLDHGRPIVVGLSGGADSVALAAALAAVGYDVVAAHCNYHLRGEESNCDMRLTQDVCRRLEIDLYVRDMDVEARRQATGESLEMACRELRYAWMHDLLDRQRAQAIAVAHHREDNIETFFLNLMRGSGICGLTGMRWRNGYVVRPLLDFTRDEIEEYLAGKSIEFAVDSTNAQNDFSRNRLRNLVLPLLSEQFPGGVDGILRSIVILGENREFYEEQIASMRERYIEGSQLRLKALLAEQKQARLILFELLRPFGFNITHIDNILESASRSGLIFSAGPNVLRLDRGTLHISTSGEALAGDGYCEVPLHRDVLQPVHIVVSQHPVTEFRPERDVNVAYFDTEILEGSPVFALRHWRRGDRISPYGMDGSKLVSDIFTGAKYGAADKAAAWLLTRNDEVIWVVGLRSSSLFSIRPETRRFLRLALR